MKFLICICFILVLTTGVVKTQDPVDERAVISTSPRHSPPALIRWLPNFNEQRPTSAVFLWDFVPRATYVLRIYEGSILQREFRNLEETIFNVTGLTDNTTYRATVSSLFRVGAVLVESVESNSTTFTTDEICRNGKIFTACLAECIFTCEYPNRVCSKVCIPGCNCDLSIHVLHDGICIPQQLCPAPLRPIRRPTNLQSFPIGNTPDRIILAWNEVDEAETYAVTVALTSDPTNVLQRLNTDIPFAQVGDLIPGEEYVFRVTANFDQADLGRSSTLPPRSVSISNIGENSFVVRWSDTPGAKSYGIRLYEGDDNNTAIYANDLIARTTIEFTNLAPGTVYNVAVSAAIIFGDPGILSPLTGVQTLGVYDPVGAGSGMSLVSAVMPLTTSPTTTTTTTTTIKLTLCQQRYNVISQFLNTADSTSSVNPRLPICDPAGFFVTTVCDEIKTNECHCIDADTGDKIEGSDYGGSNSGIPLDCNRFGTFGDPPSDIRTTGVTSSSVTITWAETPEAFAYIVILSAVGITRSTTVTDRSVEFRDLEAGKDYLIRVTGVNGRGISSPMGFLPIKTLYIDPPRSLRAFTRSPTSVRVVWRNNPAADYYNVDIFNLETNEVVQSVTQLADIVWVVTGLTPTTVYEVRVTASVMTSPGVNFTSAVVSVTTFTRCVLPPLDVLFVADISSKTGFRNLNLVKYFMANLSQILPPIDKDDATGSRLALVKYFNTPSTVFNWDRFTRTPDAVGALRFLRYGAGASNMRSMVRHVYDHFVNPARNRNPVRDGALQVVIIFSGGKSDDGLSNTLTRRLATQPNVIVFSIGVNDNGIGSSLTELELLATSINTRLVVPSYDNLNSLSVNVQQQICDFAN